MVDMDGSGENAATIEAKAKEEGLFFCALGEYRFRLVTHRDVSHEKICKSIDIIRGIFGNNAA